jgi:hypothetical protein
MMFRVDMTGDILYQSEFVSDLRLFSLEYSILSGTDISNQMLVVLYCI